jgi:hypothetical protein
MEERTLMNLWDDDHPYYCSESNYYSNEPGERYDSWAEYLAAWGPNDKDLNLLFRWDWAKPDPDNYEDGETIPDHDTLWLFYVLQRKGIFLANQVRVTEADESSVREYLEGYWRHMRLLWRPLSDAAG